jgi:3-hydroxyanthranilate 3,4-dioxygenase
MLAPFNLQKWIDENGDFIVMVVAGPNARKDYHFNESEELFYQIEGDITVRVQENGQAKDVIIQEGEMFLLPANTPHSPSRGANTVGLVIERVRKGTDLQDGLMWFCEKCNNHLKTYRFPLSNIEQDFIPRFKEFYGSEEMRTCSECGHVMEVDPNFV